MRKTKEVKRSDYISLTEIRPKFHTANFYSKKSISAAKHHIKMI